MISVSNSLRNLRRGMWHLRVGGWNQFKTFQARMNPRPEFLHANASAFRSGRVGRKRADLQFRPFSWDTRAPRRSDLTVAVILDEFSEISFQFEWNQVLLSRANWKNELRAQPVDFVFVESAWAGNSGEWRYQLTGASGPKPDFTALMDFCRATKIPTVFWNKEDPAHYEDFLDAARRFDVIFTTDSNRLEAYREDLEHDRIHVLPFAAQPVVHNPIRPKHGWRSRDVAFAGMYFANKFPERRDQLEVLLKGAIDATANQKPGLEIFSRVMNRSEYEFPNEFKRYVVGSVSYLQMLTAYKAYRVFLNANSVVNSPSMCARRVFEITASGTPLLSTPSAAIPQYFSSDEITTVSTREEAARVTRALLRNPNIADRMVHRAQRKIWSQHTYSHRVERVVQSVIPARSRPVTPPNVSVVVSTIRPHLTGRLLQILGSQMEVELEVVLLTHGFEVPTPELDRMRKEAGLENLVMLSAGRDFSLGSCLNKCVDAAGGAVITKMDDDDYYGPYYLADQLNALSYSGAQVVGKQAHYMFLEGHNATVLRFPEKEHTFTHLVMGPTIMGGRDIFTDTPFIDVSIGEDSEFLRSIREQGGLIYAADRFNYCQYRGSGDHTWEIDPHEVLGSSGVEIFGPPTEHVTI